MLQITLPDLSVKQYDKPLTVYDIAQSIGPGLAKSALAGKIDGKLVDTSYLIESDTNIEIITAKSQDGLDIIRHSTAHLLAYAVKTLYPDAQVTIGPVIENGFYYDFSYKRSFTPEDLVLIENKMKELTKENLVVHRTTKTRTEASAFFANLGEKYKTELIEAIPTDETLSLYQMGDFTDLCRGPHVPTTGFLKYFKLMKVAGAYWRANSDNEMLQRIYGTAWATKEELRDYLHRLEEAEKRDHRKIARELDLYHIQDEAPGMIFWHPKGWTIWQQIEQYIRKELTKSGYLEIKTPIIMDRSLWERSGHWENYQENMFITESEKRIFAIKPMSCPAHIEVFKKRIHSYRELPLRLAEFGHCHRNEPSGALHGLMRVRGFVQDDAHIFCTEDQIESEVAKFNQLVIKMYKTFGFENIAIKLSLRPDKRAGDDEVWDKAEQGLRNALNACHLSWEELPGEGAFYGPKVEYHIRDAIGRSWQCGTIQLDFVLPQRLDAEYTNEQNEKKIPVMLHRAIIGSFERFIGILIEHYSGQFPLWLSPIQIAILNITENQTDYCHFLNEQLQSQGFRTTLDTRNEKIGFKIREHHLQKIPYIIIIGDKEKENGTISVRHRTEDLGTMDLNLFITDLNQKIANFQ